MAVPKPLPLPLPIFGADILAQEGSLPKNTVRKAHNVVIDETGGFIRRPGYSLAMALANAHSLWSNSDRVLIASDASLYQVNLSALTVTELFDDLPTLQPVSYTEASTNIYFCAPGVLGKITSAGLVRKPGVATLLGSSPTLTATVGGLLPGRYGVAYSLINDLGEESPISSIAWIDLPTGGGILLSGLQTASHVARMNVYATTANGSELYLHSNVIAAATATVLSQTLSRPATKQYLEPMPGGSIVRFYRGRLYVASGPWLYVSEPYDHGVYDIRSGYMSFERSIAVLEPVDSGLFVGFSTHTAFLRGAAPGDFTQTVVSKRGAIAHSGTSVQADFFSGEIVPDRGKPVAVWLSEVGMAVGRPDGSVSYPQADRVRTVADRARPVFMQRTGIKQAVFCGATMGTGAVDSTL